MCTYVYRYISTRTPDNTQMKTRPTNRALEDTHGGDAMGGWRMPGRCLQALLSLNQKGG